MTQTTITSSEITERGGLPEGATAVVWTDNQIAETAEQVADLGWQTTVRGSDYQQDPAVGQLVFDPIPENAVAWKFADPTEGGRWLTEDDDVARIRHEDPSLVVALADYSQ